MQKRKPKYPCKACGDFAWIGVNSVTDPDNIVYLCRPCYDDKNKEVTYGGLNLEEWLEKRTDECQK